MSEHIRAIYENGVLRPLTPLDLEENSVVEVDVRDIQRVDSKDGDSKANTDEWLHIFDDWMASLDPNTPNLTDEQISRESIYAEQLDRQR